MTDIHLNYWFFEKISYSLQNSVLLEQIKVSEFLENGKMINEKLLNQFSIDHLLNKRMENLSGGELKKVNLVYLLNKNSDILILDEPTNHLDISAKKHLYNYLKQTKDRIIIIATHDEKLLEIADYTFSLS